MTYGLEKSKKSINHVSHITTPSAKTTVKELLGLQDSVSHNPIKDTEKNYVNRIYKLKRLLLKIKDMHEAQIIRRDNVNSPSMILDTLRIIDSNNKHLKNSENIAEKQVKQVYNQLCDYYNNASKSNEKPEFLDSLEKFVEFLDKEFKSV